MKAITKYQAADGAEFNTEGDCKAYEAEAAEIDAIMARLPERPGERSDYSNGKGYLQHDRMRFLSVQADLAKIVLRRFGKDESYRRHIEWAIYADRPAGHTFIGRLVDDACGSQMRRAWWRISCVDSEFREWGQPYFAFNPAAGELVELK